MTDTVCGNEAAMISWDATSWMRMEMRCELCHQWTEEYEPAGMRKKVVRQNVILRGGY